MKDRPLLLRSWIYQVFDEDKGMTKEKLIREFEKDAIPAMAGTLRTELEALKGGKDGR
jgi:hypothetical protein